MLFLDIRGIPTASITDRCRSSSVYLDIDMSFFPLLDGGHENQLAQEKKVSSNAECVDRASYSYSYS